MQCRYYVNIKHCYIFNKQYFILIYLSFWFSHNWMALGYSTETEVIYDNIVTQIPPPTPGF